ncbi:MAG: pseudouridine synthase [Candidatus Latescibacterota bacterium]|nr:pseudouridine synthase [Candidatus Latescibacterota bacterium]
MRTTTTESDPCVEPGVRIGVAAGMRLNRFLARAGVASRRKCDDLIAAGSVTVNGSPPTGLGDRVDPSQDLVEVNGKVVKLPRECEYVLLHKAASTIVTRWDEQARQTIYDGLKGLRPGTNAVGRLDRDTTGVLLLTDDGQMAHRLMHPRFEVEKRYEVLVEGVPGNTVLEKLRRGVELEDGMATPAEVRRLDNHSERRGRLEIVLHEGRKHQVKRMCLAVGHRVRYLRRLRFAGLHVGDLRPGLYRHLTAMEVRDLRRLVELE